VQLDRPHNLDVSAERKVGQRGRQSACRHSPVEESSLYIEILTRRDTLASQESQLGKVDPRGYSWRPLPLARPLVTALTISSLQLLPRRPLDRAPRCGFFAVPAAAAAAAGIEFHQPLLLRKSREHCHALMPLGRGLRDSPGVAGEVSRAV
jgi:hypothetical protein